MAEMVTRCPQCSTSFRITPAQIQKARGAVRCGSCLHIFNAEKHLIEGKPSRRVGKKPSARAEKAPKPQPQQERLAIDEAPRKERPKPATRPTTKATPPKRKDKLTFDQAQIDRESEIGDDTLISDNMGRKQDDDDNALFIDTSQQSHSLFERKIEDSPREFVDDSDESWADSLLEEDSGPQPSAPNERGGDGAAFDNPLSIVNAEPKASRSKSDAIQSPAPSVPDEPTYNAPPPRFHLAATDDEQSEYSEQLRAYDSDRSALLMGIDPQPVEMTQAFKEHWKKRLFWGALSLLALALLAGQIAWLQFDRLSRIQPYRDYYQLACEQIGCTLAPVSDPARIRTFNLVVRNHPEQDGALVVDAMILNSAPFTQPYPDLRLTFTDINDKPVASRTFTKQEYLKGELAGSNVMPKNQPIHLSLELLDPGEQAVNYRLDIR